MVTKFTFLSLGTEFIIADKIFLSHVDLNLLWFSNRIFFFDITVQIIYPSVNCRRKIKTTYLNRNCFVCWNLCSGNILSRLYYKLIIFTYYPSMRVFQESPIDFFIIHCFTLSYILSRFILNRTMLLVPIASVAQISMPLSKRLVCKQFERTDTLFCPRTLKRATRITSRKTKRSTSSTNNLGCKKYLIFISCKILV